LDTVNYIVDTNIELIDDDRSTDSESYQDVSSDESFYLGDFNDYDQYDDLLMAREYLFQLQSSSDSTRDFIGKIGGYCRSTKELLACIRMLLNYDLLLEAEIGDIVDFDYSAIDWKAISRRVYEKSQFLKLSRFFAALGEMGYVMPNSDEFKLFLRSGLVSCLPDGTWVKKGFRFDLYTPYAITLSTSDDLELSLLVNSRSLISVPLLRKAVNHKRRKGFTKYEINRKLTDLAQSGYVNRIVKGNMAHFVIRGEGLQRLEELVAKRNDLNFNDHFQILGQRSGRGRGDD
jgi:hypothetical protein